MADTPRNLTTDDIKTLPWRSIGPATMGGRVAALAFAPGNGKTFYVGYASGGVWKTTNFGTTFKPIFDKEVTSTIGAIAVVDAPAAWDGWTAEEKKAKKKNELVEAGKGKVVWVGTGEGNGRNSSSWGNGVYRSTDAGETWQHCGLEQTHDIPAMAADPNNPDVCYVAALGHLWGENEERGLYKTTDGGKTWNKILYIDERTGCCDVRLDPQNPNIVYAAMYMRRRTAYSFSSGGSEGGLYKSTDGGATWKKLMNGLPAQTGRIGIDIFLRNPNILMAVVQSNEGGTNDIRDDRSKAGGVFRSEDGGETWTRQSVRTPRAFYFCRIYIHPTDDQKVYLPGWVIEVSDDGGKTFRGGVGVKLHVDMHAMIINPDDPDHMVNGNDGGAYQSFDGGKTWTFLNQMAVGQFYNVAVDMSDPYRVAGGLQDNGTWVGPSGTNKETGKNDDGTINTGITNHDWNLYLWGDGFHAAFDPTDANVVYGEWQGGNLTRVRLDTGDRDILAPRQAEGGPRFRFNWNSPFFVSPHDPTVLYLGGNNVFKFTERGDKWEQISGDLTTNDVSKLETVGSSAETHCTLVSLAESTITPGLLWAGSDDGLVHVTQDGGATWKNVTPPQVGGLYISRIEPSHAEAGRAYVSVDGHRSDDFRALILVTEDFGTTWNECQGDLPDGWSVMVVREDLRNPNVLYCGTENGLYVSANRGQNWVKTNNGKSMPTVPVYDIVQHPRDMDLIIGTHGRSIYVLDGASFFNDLTQEVLDAPLYLFPIRDSRPRFLLTYAGLWSDNTFRAANPAYGAIINYWIREYQNESVSITIENAKGVEVQSLTGSNAPGMNRVVWDLLPKEHFRTADQGQDPSMPIHVQPGEYKVKIKYGELKAERTLTILSRV